MESVPLTEERPSPSGAVSGIAIVLALGTFVIFGTVLQAIHPGAGLWVSEVFCFVGLPALILRQTGTSPVRLVGLDGFLGRSALLGAVIGAANVFAWASPLAWVCERVFPKSMVERFDQAHVFEGHTATGMVLVLSAVSLAAPFCEELLFRGLLQGALVRRLAVVPALLLTAIVFAAFHMNPVALVPLVQVGLLFGVLAWRSGSVWPGICAHAANNITSTLQYFLTGHEGAEGATPGEVASWFAVGNLVLAGVVVLVWRRPQLLSSPRPAEAVRVAPGDTKTLVRGGLAAMLLSYAALVGLDFRGAQVNFAEQLAWLPKLPANASPERKAARARLEEERKKLLAGESSFSAYLEVRREQQKAEKGNEEPK